MMKGLFYGLLLMLCFGLQPFLWWWSLTVTDDIAQFTAIFGLFLTGCYQVIITYKVYGKLIRKRSS